MLFPRWLAKRGSSTATSPSSSPRTMTSAKSYSTFDSQSPSTSQTSPTTTKNSTHCSPTIRPRRSLSAPDLQKLDSLEAAWDTETFPTHATLFDSLRNGTLRSEIGHAIRNPRKTASRIQRAEIDLPAVTARLCDWADEASTAVNDTLNHAFDGQDLPAIHGRFVDRVSSLPIPSIRRCQRALDSCIDAFENLTTLSHAHPEVLDQDLQGDSYAFAHMFGAQARRALVTKNICQEWDIMVTRQNLSWQCQLDQTLAETFTREKETYGIERLFGMAPAWMFDEINGAWVLWVDTGIANVEDDASGRVTEGPLLLYTGFELPESLGHVTADFSSSMLVESIEE